MNHLETISVSCPRANRIKLFFAIAVLVMGVLRASVMEGAEPNAVSPATEAGTANQSIPQTIQLAEIAPRSDEAITRLTEIDSRLASDKSIGEITQAVAQFKEKTERWWKERAISLEPPSSLVAVTGAARELRRYRREIAELNGVADKAAIELAALQTEVEGIQNRWRKARLAAVRDRLDKPILRRVEEVIRTASQVDARLKARTSILVEAESRISEIQAMLGGFGEQIENARAQQSANLFALDSPPLWQAIRAAGSGQAVSRQALDSHVTLADRAKTFLEEYGTRLPYHLITFIIILAGIYSLRRATRKELSQREEFSAALKLLGRPISAALLLVSILALVFYPSASAEIFRILTFVTMIPLVRFVQTAIDGSWRRVNYLLIGLSFIEYLRIGIPAALLLDRLVLLALDCVAVTAILGLLRGRRSALQDGWIRLFALRVAGVLLLIAILGNLIGNVSLASFLTSATLRGGYLGLILYFTAELLVALTAVAMQSSFARNSLILRDHSELIAARCATFFRAAAFVVWFISLVFVFGFLGGLFSGGANFLNRRWQVGAAGFSFEDLVAFALVLLAAVLISRLLRFVLTEEVFPRVRLPRGVPDAVNMLSKYAILTIGFLIALAAAGVDLSRVTLVLSALGVGLGFGLQNMVSNFVSGLVLAFERPIQVGDTIQVGALFGKVRNIGFRASVIRTFDGAEVIIPNGELVWAQVINWSLSDQIRRVTIHVGAAYGTDPNHVLEILSGVAAKHPNVLTYPAPEALFDGFGDSSLNFQLRCWTQLSDFVRVRSELAVGVNNAFKAENITIPFPQRDVHVDLQAMPQSDGNPLPDTEPDPASLESKR